MADPRYFDHAATTPTDPRVVEAMLPFFGEAFGNPNSLHDLGRRAHLAVEQAREQVAELLGADDPNQIIFTSGATEANNWVIQRAARPACSPFEHSSVREAVLAKGGEILSNDGFALLSPTSNPDLLAVMAVNNENGVMLEPPPELGRARVLCDLTQAVGKVPLPDWPFDFGTLSAHKLYGPKGVGALWIRNPEYLEPLLYGGEQEQGRRAGTLNVAGIVGFGKAAEIATAQIEQDFEHALALRSAILLGLEDVDDCRIHQGTKQSPFILSLSIRGLEGETLIVEADQAGFALSSGAACSSRRTDPSHVLLAMGLPDEWRRGTIRISIGRANTLESGRKLVECLARTVGTLRRARV